MNSHIQASTRRRRPEHQKLACVPCQCGSRNPYKDIQRELHRHKKSTISMRSRLRAIHRHNDIKQTRPPTVDKTGKDHPNMVLSRALQTGTKDGPSRAEGDCVDAAELVAEPACWEGGGESAEIVYRNLFSY